MVSHQLLIIITIDFIHNLSTLSTSTTTRSPPKPSVLTPDLWGRKVYRQHHSYRCLDLKITKQAWIIEVCGHKRLWLIPWTTTDLIINEFISASPMCSFAVHLPIVRSRRDTKLWDEITSNQKVSLHRVIYGHSNNTFNCFNHFIRTSIESYRQIINSKTARTTAKS